jgi:hypothetical protein
MAKQTLTDQVRAILRELHPNLSIDLCSGPQLNEIAGMTRIPACSPEQYETLQAFRIMHKKEY